MQKRKTIYIIVLVILAIATTLFPGFTSPPKVVHAKDLPEIQSIRLNDKTLIKLNKEEKEYWKGLSFEIAKNETPGNTTDFVVELSTESTEFTAIYNKGEDYIFFSFYPEIKYSFLNTPAPGGWNKPLYKIKSDHRITKFLRIPHSNKDSYLPSPK